MLSYMDVHLRYTLSAIGVLVLVARPFISRSEVFKIAFVSAIAVIYTTPWDSYMIYSGVWTYPADRVLMFVGYVPVEEYVFFVLQTVLTGLWTLLCTRWRTPCTCFNYDRRSYQLIRWIPVMVLVAATVIGYWKAEPGRPMFYLCCLLYWICPVLAFLWYNVGNYTVRILGSSFVAVAVPTVYLCWLDQIAIEDGVWSINESSSLGMLADHLPGEEVLFFFISNITVVLAMNSYDKARGLIETYTSAFPLRFSVSWPYVKQMFWAFLISEYSMPSIVADDVEISATIIKVASKSFSAAGYLFSSGKSSLSSSSFQRGLCALLFRSLIRISGQETVHRIRV